MSTAAPLCLTDEELKDLTGSPLASHQMKWLDTLRWPYVVNLRGKPRVARALAEQRLGVAAANDDASTPGAEPDWAAGAKG